MKRIFYRIKFGKSDNTANHFYSRDYETVEETMIAKELSYAKNEYWAQVSKDAVIEKVTETVEIEIVG